jgi:UDP-N-acetylglucosamine/UDP-N-acetylgalactosamine diphosphorylase
MNRENILDLLEKHGQGHILDHYRSLGREEQDLFLRGLSDMDLDLVFRLHEEVSSGGGSRASRGSLSPAPVIPVPRSPEEVRDWKDAFHTGESLLRANRVAVLIVAGGQGTRLGFPGPKGSFPVSPVKNKPLFQLFAESVGALSARYRADLPLLIMTSRENHEETRGLFETRGFFGLPRETVHFFSQGLLPTLTPDGRLILRERTNLLANPDGHGGSLKALHESGMAARLRERGIEEIFYCQVDNPLVRIADPAFIGYHRQGGAEISTKVVRRQNLEEKVGIYGLVDGRPAVVEYSDFSPEEYRSLDGKGNILYWAGNTAIHMISLPFVERLNRQGFALPYHRAVKEVEGLSPDGGSTKMTGWKFETFVFDAIPLARKSCSVEVVREEEFSPVKNHSGMDSPETARKAMSGLFRSWLAAAGAEVAPEARVEISPLFALDKEELAAKLKGKKVMVKGDTYFE